MMNFVDFEAGNKSYKLRLSTKNVVMLEKQLGSNPLSIFGDGDRLPTITEMVNILYCSLIQLNHGINLNDAYDIFDAYLEEHSATDFVLVILEIYKASGLIKADEEETEKN